MTISRIGRRTKHRTAQGPEPALHHALRRYHSWSLAMLLMVSLATFLLARPVASDIALREATVRGSAFARSVVAPLVNREVRAGDREQVAALDYLLRNRMKDGSITHMKIWTQGGRVLWSNTPSLVGRTFPLEDDVARLFGSLAVSAQLSDLTKEENAVERGEGPLLEVYVGVRDADNVPLVFESYWSPDRISADESAILVRFAPLAIGSLLLFMLTMRPLAVSLARRVDRGQQERSIMLRHALSASDLERRRIAHDLHDGLIQDLAGLRYALPALAAELRPESVDARAVLKSASESLERDVTGLRAMLTDIYPADLSQGGLRAAVEELAARARATGVAVEVELTEAVANAPLEVAQLTYRILREGLRNVVKHAQAAHVQVRADVVDGEVLLEVTDDGVGVPPFAGLDTSPQSGHLGLRLVRDTVRDLGGRLSLDNRSAGGASLQSRFPLAFATSWAG